MELTPRKATLVLFLRNAPKALDPIRVQKGMFLFSMRASSERVPIEARYTFEPYNYGPCSFEIYSDLDELVASGAVIKEEAAGQRWKRYSLSEHGQEIAERIAQKNRADVSEYLGKIREYVVSLSFSDLLKTVYRLYPQYAVNSVFKS